MRASKLPKVGTTIFTVMSQLAAEHDAVNLGQGFPDFPPPARLVDSLDRAMRAGHNQYAPMSGIPALRKAIADKTERCYGFRPDADALREPIEAAIAAGIPVLSINSGSDVFKELGLLIDSAPLWRDGATGLPANVLSRLQALQEPSTLTRSVLALALWRSKNIDGAKKQLTSILADAKEHPFATVLLAEMDRQVPTIADPAPEPSTPPPEPEPTTRLTPEKNKKTQTTGSTTKRLPPEPERAPPPPVPLQSLVDLKKKLRDIGGARGKECRAKVTDGPVPARKLTVTLWIEIDDNGKIKATTYGSSVDVSEADCLAVEITGVHLGPFEGPKTPFVETFKF